MIWISNKAPQSKPRVVCIGNFDGFHLGHQQLIREAGELARKLGLPLSCLSFSPLPKEFFGKSKNQRLFTDSLRKTALLQFGVEEVFFLSFNEQLRNFLPEQFINRILQDALQAKGVVTGENFKFGINQSGDIQTLADLAKTYNFTFKAVKLHQIDKMIVSSSLIRQEISKGKIQSATTMLGHPFLIDGTIARGQQLGRQLGFPTINLEGIKQILPAHGVYSGRVCLSIDDPIIFGDESRALPCVINIGLKPTTGDFSEPSVEAHIIDKKFADNELYGMQAYIYFDSRLRDEKKFSDVEQLKQAISDDIQKSRSLGK